MLDTHVKNFLASGSERDALNVVRFCRSSGLFHIGETLGKCLVKLYPHDWNILNEAALCAFYSTNYTVAYDLFSRILEFNNLAPNDVKTILFNAHFCIDHVADRYNYYNPPLVKSLTKRKKRSFPMVTFTMTSCKRYDLFEQTINSFINCCTDLHKIDHFLCVDDNSSEEDRQKMKKKFPFIEFYFKTVEEKGHPQSMNIIKKKVQTPYILHVEDDWKFFSKRPYITECFDVLHSNPTIGQCLINKNYGETESDIDILGGVPNTTAKGLRYLIHDFCPDPQEFARKYGGAKQCGYWQHFSLRPSLLRVSVLNQLGDFNETISHFERDYCHRYITAGYVSAFLENIYCIHIGRLTSERHDKTKPNAYELNGEAQFSGKEQKLAPPVTDPPVTAPPVEEKKPETKSNTAIKFKVFVVNMDNRPDRWDKFKKNDVGINYARYSAVDGSKLKSTPQLLRIFDGNDYNMRVGMVGCAMSHIKLCTELINSDYTFFVILEDDIELVPNFKNKLIKVLTETPTGWDLIYLGHHYWPKHRKPEYYDKEIPPKIEKWSRAQSLKFSMGGTGGYIISRKGAENLLNFLDQTGMVNCIDTMQQKSADDLNIYYCTPHLIYSECYTGQKQGELDTDIQFNYESLTVDMNTRYADELVFYKDSDIKTVVDYKEMDSIVQDPATASQDCVYFYRNDENSAKIAALQITCKHPCYTIGNAVLVVVPKPKENCRYFHRFKKGDRFAVDDAVQYK